MSLQLLRGSDGHQLAKSMEAEKKDLLIGKPAVCRSFSPVATLTDKGKVSR